MTVRCPLCKKPSQWEGNSYRPFCSERCKIIDLGKWAEGEYRIKGKAISETPMDTQEAPRNHKKDEN